MKNIRSRLSSAVLMTVVAVAVAACNPATTQQSRPATPGTVSPASVTPAGTFPSLDGSWESTQRDRKGELKLHSLTKEPDGTYSGVAQFGGKQSACPWETEFSGGTLEGGVLKFSPDLGGRCGVIHVTLRQGNHQRTYVGTYEAPANDKGKVALSGPPQILN